MKIGPWIILLIGLGAALPAAAQLRLRRGDIVAGIDHREITSVAQLRDLLAGSSPPWALVIARGDKKFSFFVR
ncbi:MAG: hypothetical protein ACREEL_12450 [Stellaceae bacterium]